MEEYTNSGNLLNTDTISNDTGGLLNMEVMPTRQRKLPDTFSFDEDLLLSMWFTPEEIQYFGGHLDNLGALTRSKLMACGVAPNYADLFLYMYRICSGTLNSGAGVDLQGYLGLSQHLQKLFKCRYLTGEPTHDIEVQRSMCVTKEKLPRGSYSELPRRVEIEGIPEDSKFAIYNSNRYKFYDRLYVVKPGTNMGQNLTLQTDKQPRLAYREKKELEGILELKDINKAGVTDLIINREYTKMHNVFYITVQVGDMTAFEHYGAFKIVAWDGTILTVKVEVWVPRKQMVKKVENKRVYEIGYFPSEILPKLTKIACQVCQSQLVQGVKMEPIEATLDFETITEVSDEEEEIEIE